MSKNVTLICTIVQVEPNLVKTALENLIKFLDGQLTTINRNKYMVYSPKIGNVTVTITEKAMQISGMDISAKVAQRYIEGFYTMTQANHDFVNQMIGPMEHNKQKEELVLRMEV